MADTLTQPAADASDTAAGLIDLAAIDGARSSAEPYPHLVGEGFIRPEAVDALRTQFPPLDVIGFLTVKPDKIAGIYGRLLDELEGPELTAAVSRKLGLDLSPYPRMTQIMGRSHERYGRVHTDGLSKIATMLVYLNDDWPLDGAGQIRVLRSDKDMEDYVEEVRPLMGNVFAFLRTDNSWHGHTPYKGERRVIQITWLRSEDDIDRKHGHSRVQQMFKRLFGAKG